MSIDERDDIHCVLPKHHNGDCKTAADMSGSAMVAVNKRIEMQRGETENDHRAIVECSVPPSTQFIASGPRQWCVDRLVGWTEKHPTPQYSAAYVVAVTDEVICEPGVGVYVVPLEPQKETER